MCIRDSPYGAIMKMERPCAKACGMDAIQTDEHGHADIDYDKCVSLSLIHIYSFIYYDRG